jgi:hypothetical protein
MSQHFIALPFVATSAGLVPGSPVGCLSAEVAIMRAKALFSLPNTAGDGLLQLHGRPASGRLSRCGCSHAARRYA